MYFGKSAVVRWLGRFLRVRPDVRDECVSEPEKCPLNYVEHGPQFI